MNATFSCKILRLVKASMLLSVVSLMTICNAANAVLLTFDELDESSYVDANGDRTFLTNEYESQGLLFGGSAYLISGQPTSEIHPSNYVAGPGFGFEFVGNKLPEYVSFVLGSSTGSAVFIDVIGPNFSKHVTSAGEIHGMTDDHGTAYIPNQFFSFSSSTGISSIIFSSQGDEYIDNLTYAYTSPIQVPEPSAYILLVVGLIGLFGSRFKYLLKI
ncbi:MAG: PEP-CTERM sorting domain-containing protein [Gammaproteobacteria bacterium]|nr:MAG: PEP-CTERM sorting domain-containing protein [Gammaproteobacteria bacterium]